MRFPFSKKSNQATSSTLGQSVRRGVGFDYGNPLAPSSDKYFKSILRACVLAIADEISQIKLSVISKTEGEEVSEDFNNEISGLLDILQNPNPDMTGSQLMFITSTQLSLYGESYWLIIREDLSDDIQFLVPIPKKDIQFEKNALGGISFYRITRGDTQEDVLPENVVRFIRPNPNDLTLGLGLLDGLKDVLELETSAIAKQKALAKNSTNLGGLLKVDPTNLTPDRKAELSDHFRKYYSAEDNAGKVVFINKDQDFVPINQNIQELQLIPLRQFNADQIKATARVGRIILGEESGSNRATAETAEYVFAKYTISSQMRIIVNSLNKWVLPMFSDRVDIELSFKSPVPVDKEYQLKLIDNGLKNGWMTLNEARALQNLPTNTSPAANELRVPLNLVPLNFEDDVAQRRESDTEFTNG